eukprot:10764367-Heterocapsa_arctica.AAC.1
MTCSGASTRHSASSPGRGPGPGGAEVRKERAQVGTWGISERGSGIAYLPVDIMYHSSGRGKATCFAERVKSKRLMQWLEMLIAMHALGQHFQHPYQ